jgi:hypothetical protein
VFDLVIHFHPKLNLSGKAGYPGGTPQRESDFFKSLGLSWPLFMIYFLTQINIIL